MSPVSAIPPASALKGTTEIEEPSRGVATIGRRSAEIRATVPDLELGSDVDAGAALDLMQRSGVSMAAILTHACAAALRALPWANAAYRDGRFERYGNVNIGITLQVGESQLIAAVLDADKKSIDVLTDEITHLTARAEAGELTPPEQAGTTFTLTDHSGPDGPHRWSSLVIPPQAAALTVGSVHAAAVVRDGAVVAGHQMSLTLTCDHRILFGARAAELMERIAEGVEAPNP